MLARWPPLGPFLLRLVFVALLLTMTQGCSKGSARLAGHWRGIRAEGTTGPADTAANAYAGRMQIDVSGDVVTVTSPAGKETGHYKVVSEDKSTTVITTGPDGGAGSETFTLVDAKTLSWSVAAGKAIIFTKE
jgi:hypothetical protein